MSDSTFGEYLERLRNDSRDYHQRGRNLSVARLAALFCQCRKLDESVYDAWTTKIRRWEKDEFLPRAQEEREELVALLAILRQAGGIPTLDVANQLLDRGRYARLNTQEVLTVFGPQFSAAPPDFTPPPDRVVSAPVEVYGYLYRRRTDTYEERYELRRDRILIGRNPAQVDILLPLSLTFASNLHAVVMRAGGGVWIEDLNSRNGTFINGQKITNAVCLAPGQRLLLGGNVVHPKVCMLEFSLDPLIPTESPDNP